MTSKASNKFKLKNSSHCFLTWICNLNLKFTTSTCALSSTTSCHRRSTSPSFCNCIRWFCETNLSTSGKFSTQEKRPNRSIWPRWCRTIWKTPSKFLRSTTTTETAIWKKSSSDKSWSTSATNSGSTKKSKLPRRWSTGRQPSPSERTQPRSPCKTWTDRRSSTSTRRLIASSTGFSRSTTWTPAGFCPLTSSCFSTNKSSTKFALW